MVALAYRDDKILARNLLSRPFFCLTPAEPFFRPDRSPTAPSCRVAVKDGRAFRGHPKGLSLTAASTMARWRYRSGRRPCVAAERVSSPRRSSRLPASRSRSLYEKSGNSNREAHQLSRFREHQTACSCLPARWLDRTARARAALATGPSVFYVVSRRKPGADNGVSISDRAGPRHQGGGAAHRSAAGKMAARLSGQG